VKGLCFDDLVDRLRIVEPSEMRTIPAKHNQVERSSNCGSRSTLSETESYKTQEKLRTIIWCPQRQEAWKSALGPLPAVDL